MKQNSFLKKKARICLFSLEKRSLYFYSIEEFYSKFPLSDPYCWSWQQLSLTPWFVSNRSSHPFLMRLRSRTPRSFSDAGGMTDGKLAHAHYTHTEHIPTSVRGNVIFSIDVRRQCTASLIALTSLHSQSNVKTGMQAPHFTADRKKKKHWGDIQGFFTYNRSTKFKPVIQSPTYDPFFFFFFFLIMCLLVMLCKI